MSESIQPLFRFLQTIEAQTQSKPTRGRPLRYSHTAMLLFFITMALKGIHAFKTMTDYAEQHYARFGFEQAPSRKTLRRRFLALPTVIQIFMPRLAAEAHALDERFDFRIAFVDKSLFRACGGIWHKRDMKTGRVPHVSIDTDASWGRSAYHGWRFGYGLHLLCNSQRFPVMASVTTASTKEYHVLAWLLSPLAKECLLVVADAGYRSIRVLKDVWKQLRIFVLLPCRFKTLSVSKRWYNTLFDRTRAQWLYARRKPSIEPVFSLVKQLYALTGEAPLPYRGLARVQAYLLLSAFSVQVLMLYNSIHRHPLQATKPFRLALD